MMLGCSMKEHRRFFDEKGERAQSESKKEVE